MKKNKQSLLWQIQHQNQQITSYVFGTMHVKNSTFFSNLDEVYCTIQQADYYAAEYNFKDQASSQNPISFQLPNSKDLTFWLEEKRYKKTQNILQKAFQIDLTLIKKLQPLFIINLITQQILSSNSSVSLDEHLWQYAKAQGKFCTGVESLSEQTAVLKKITVEEQVKMLVNLAKDVKKYRQQLLHTAEIYQSGDIQKLYKTTKKSTGKLRKMLLYRRNIIMAERIAQLSDNQSIFAAIGAAHLAGEKGVLRYLKQSGLKVKPIPIQSRR